MLNKLAVLAFITVASPTLAQAMPQTRTIGTSIVAAISTAKFRPIPRLPRTICSSSFARRGAG